MIAQSLGLYKVDFNAEENAMFLTHDFQEKACATVTFSAGQHVLFFFFFFATKGRHVLLYESKL